MRDILALLFCTCLALSFATKGKADAEAPVQASDAYVREPPPGQPNAALFMTLTNLGKRSLELIGASCAVASRCELHTHRHGSEGMRMERVSSLEIAPSEKLVFKPGGLHLMLIGLKQPLRAGSQIEVSLRFADGRAAKVVATVRDMRRRE